MATGVLPLFFGAATRAQDLITDRTKRYRATVQLGLSTDTGDVTGRVTATGQVQCTEQGLREAAQGFLGRIMQVPPMYSAVKQNGRRLYKLAREGITVERRAREVEVYGIDFLLTDIPNRTLALDIRCSKGTYIRVLCEDLCAKAGVLSTLRALRRTESAGFTEDRAVSLVRIEEALHDGSFDSLLMPVDGFFAGYIRVDLNEDLARMFRNGKVFETMRCGSYLPEGENTAVYAGGRFIGLGRSDGGQFVKTMHYAEEV